MLGQRLVDRPVAEQLGDIDRKRVEQSVVFTAVAVEDASVIMIRVHASRSHAHRDAASQTLLLVAGTREATIARDLARQLLEFRIAGRRRWRRCVGCVRTATDHPRTWRTDSRLVRTIAFSGSSSR